MLDLLTTDAFASWYSSLEAGPAEDVAATLEVIVQLGTSQEAPKSSEMLLWYEHPSLAQRPLPDTSKMMSPELLKLTQEWQHFAGYVKRVVKHLESPQFMARARQISPANAAIVADALTTIRRVSWARPAGLSKFRVRRLARVGVALKAADVEALARFLDTSEVRVAYFAALGAAGFEMVDLPATSAALREISLRAAPPGLRLLYGIDAPKNRGLVVLGEWLDRSFYGDAVRRAEAVWAQFLKGQPLVTQAAPAR